MISPDFEFELAPAAKKLMEEWTGGEEAPREGRLHRALPVERGPEGQFSKDRALPVRRGRVNGPPRSKKKLSFYCREGTS